MAINFRRTFHNFLELVEGGSRWTEETRDQFVNSTVLWFCANKEEILIKFKKNAAVCLAVVVQLAFIVINSFLLGDEEVIPRWKASWIARMSIFAIIFFTLKICVEIKRFRLTWWKDKEVWVFIVTHFLQFLIPLLYILLAYAYLMGIDTNSQHMRSDWKTFASGIKTSIHVVGSLLSFIGAIYYWTPDDHQSIAFPTNVDNLPVVDEFKLDVVVHTDAENQSVAHANSEEVEQRDTESKPVCMEKQSVGDANLDVVGTRNVENQPVEDALQVVVHNDAENQSVEDANLDVAVQRYVESQPVGVKNKPVADASFKVVGQSNGENQTVADVSEAMVQSNGENQPVADAKLDAAAVLRIDAENQPVADAKVVKGNAEKQHFVDVLEVFTGGNVEDQVVMDANLSSVVHRDVENQPVADENLKLVIERDMENQPVAYVSETVVKKNVENQPVVDAKLVPMSEEA